MADLQRNSNLLKLAASFPLNLLPGHTDTINER